MARLAKVPRIVIRYIHLLVDNLESFIDNVRQVHELHHHNASGEIRQDIGDTDQVDEAVVEAKGSRLIN